MRLNSELFSFLELFSTKSTYNQVKHLHRPSFVIVKVSNNLIEIILIVIIMIIIILIMIITVMVIIVMIITLFFRRLDERKMSQ